MAKYRKKALLVTAKIADQQQYITTLEGVSEAKPGDFIITGVDNEQWVVKPKWFHRAYTHIRNDTYQRKPQVLEAVQIDEPEVVKAPTGDIKGDKDDYKVTGTGGEQWFVKPDIFKKTYERVSKSMANSMTGLQKAINQIGEDAVKKSIPMGYKIGRCEMHGAYLVAPEGTPVCPVCPAMPDPNGTDAEQVEHYINIREAVGLDGTNPQQRYGV